MNTDQKKALQIPEKVMIIETKKSMEIRDVGTPNDIKFDIDKIFMRKKAPYGLNYALKIYRSKGTSTLYIALVDRRRKIAVKAPLHAPGPDSYPDLKNFKKQVNAALEVVQKAERNDERFDWVVSDSWMR